MVKRKWSDQVIEALDEQWKIAQAMLQRSPAGFSSTSPRFLLTDDEALYARWLSKTDVVIRRVLGEAEAKIFRSKNWGESSSYVRCGKCFDFLTGLLKVAREHPSQLTYTEPALSAMKNFNSPPTDVIRKSEHKSGGTVFIIHGRDEVNVLKLERHLKDKFQLPVCILSEKPAQGRTLIEKFEDEAGKCGFAFCLFTPDDHVTFDRETYAQARPNAVFELGWFCGRIGREKTCILMSSGTRIHSDLNGVNRIEFVSSVLESAEPIERELRAASLLK